MPSQLKKPLVFETAFSTYTVTALVGQGGSGVVYSGQQEDGTPVAIKLLSKDRATRDKRSRFKNEIAFLTRARHKNLVKVIDHGLNVSVDAPGPFYVMPKYDFSLRDLMLKGLESSVILGLFSQVLDGMEAAHLLGAVHRDLKPENILWSADSKSLAVADFGIAKLTEDLLVTAIETATSQRLANFVYAAPEQRKPGAPVTAAADMYALGLMLNELFTGEVPHGTNYRLIGQDAPQYEYLDEIVARMTRQLPQERPQSIADLKGLLEQSGFQATSRQRLSAVSQEVVPTSFVDDPLALEPVRVVAANWDGQFLHLTLDKPVSRAWIDALHGMGNYTSVHGRGPENFEFVGNRARVPCDDNEAAEILAHFKHWMPMASRVLKHNLEVLAEAQDRQQRELLRVRREAEELKARVNQGLRV